MVTIGFIVEGDSEAIIFKSASFQAFLTTLGLRSSPDFVINVEGKGKLYHPHGDVYKLKEPNDARLATLYAKGCEKVFIVLDRDNDDACFTEFKSKVYHHPDNVVVVVTQELEAWFLADTAALNAYFKTENLNITAPEDFECPFDEIRRLCFLHKNRGLKDKTILAGTMIRCGFSLAAAAAHPACPSATYFQRKLIEAASNR